MREPVAVTTAISVAIKAILLAVMAFGLEITAEQLAAVMFAVDSVLALVLVLVVRSQVVPVQRANAQIETAQRMPNATVSQVVEAQKKTENL